ncbi:YxlC family protein [Paenibacillus taiwanensis]|uniref:YxlC family protein n=1 Tax=Paenibacillus taiwanensis TaxID=401638 RepID=UPI000403C048|nr:YxlC family protein [Paenibacillus taiwanensis]
MKHNKLPETDVEWSALFKEELGKVDVLSNEESIPDQTYLITMLTEHKQKQKQALWRELRMLWLVAVVVLAGGLAVAMTDISVYVMLQFVLLIGALGGLLMREYKLKRQRRGASHD